MCFYYAVIKTNAKKLVQAGIITEKQLELFPEQTFVNGFDNPLMPVISSKTPEEISLYRWGFVPAHIGTQEEAEAFLAKYNTRNAKAETLFHSRLFADAIRSRRCLVLCSGFFEWRHKDPGKKNSEKYPFYVTLKDEGMFLFGGIWEQFTDRSTGEIISTYSIITTPANELMELIHNSKKRMPLIIDSENALKWLDSNLPEDEIKEMVKPFDSSRLKARSIKKINPKLQNENDPDVTVYYQYNDLTSLLNAYPEYFEQSIDLRGNSPTLF